VVDSLEMEAPKTKEMKRILGNLNAEKALVVVGEDAANALYSVKNLQTVRGVYSNSINVYDILKYDTVVVTKDAVKSIEEVYA
jgi:large subunit ribosomal protein L4